MISIGKKKKAKGVSHVIGLCCKGRKKGKTYRVDQSRGLYSAGIGGRKSDTWLGDRRVLSDKKGADKN